MPSGTSSDPYVAHTYDELVTLANLGGYIVIANDIDIANEYPDGDMPTLYLNNAYIDGANHTINNWYKIGSQGSYTIFSGNSAAADASEFKNLNFNNIYMAGTVVSFFQKANYNDSFPAFKNCTFRGVLYKPFTAGGNARVVFKQCGLYLDSIDGKPFELPGAEFEDTRLQVTSTYNNTGFLSGTYGKNYICKNSYIELHLPNVDDGGLDSYGLPYINSIIDITSNAAITLGYGSNATTIVNGINAPNIVPDGTNCKLVDDAEHWLNPTWLHDNLGFNAG